MKFLPNKCRLCGGRFEADFSKYTYFKGFYYCKGCFRSRKKGFREAR